MPRHVRVGFRRYSALQGIDLTRLKIWSGRVFSMETLVTKLANSLRKHGFRPFRPLEASSRPNETSFESRITGLKDVSVRFRLPWQPNRLSCALSIELKGQRLHQKRLQGLTHQGHQVVYDATATISGGVAIFRGRRWRTMRRANFNRLLPGAVDKILRDLEAAAGPNADAGGLPFNPYNEDNV